MSGMQRPTDAQLMAYIDGELDAEGVIQVERAIAADPALARLVRALFDSDAALRAAFNAPMLEPVPERLLAPLGAQHARTWRLRSGIRMLAMAASLAILVIGGLSVYAASGYELPFTIVATAKGNWLNSVANYHNVYVRTAARDERLLVDVGAEDVAFLEGWFGKRLKHDVRLPNLEGHGFHIQGGRVMFVESQPGAQFFYKAVNGDDVISLTMAQTRRPDVEPTFTKRGDLHMIYWRKGGYTYVFAGAVERHVLQSMTTILTEDQQRI